MAIINVILTDRKQEQYGKRRLRTIGLRHEMSPFFFGCAKNLGICEATKDSSGASSKLREKKERLWAAFGGAFELGQHLRGVVT